MATGSGGDPAAALLLSFPIIGALITTRQPRSAIGWIMLAIGVAGAAVAMLEIYVEY